MKDESLIVAKQLHHGVMESVVTEPQTMHMAHQADAYRFPVAQGEQCTLHSVLDFRVRKHTGEKMKKTCGLTFALAMALLASTAHAATDPIGSSKTPEQVGDLYLAAGLGNMDKAKELNNYLLPHYAGADKTDILKMAELITGKLSDLSSMPTKDNPELVMFSAMILAMYQRSTCHATGSTIHSGGNGNALIATVTTECYTPDPEKIKEITSRFPDGKLTLKEANEAAAAIKALPAEKVTGSLDLNADVAHHIWFNDDASSDPDAKAILNSR